MPFINLPEPGGWPAPPGDAAPAPPTPGVTPPELDDPHQFERKPAIPLLDVHTRNGRFVDEAKLRLVCANSNARAARGNPALLLIGHTDDHGPETHQPPLVGFVRGFVMGEWQGSPCILGDLFYARDRLAEAMGYPHRSVEVFYSDEPSQNYLAAVSLLVREPERDLGLVTYAKVRERYALVAQADPPPPPPGPGPGPDEPPAPDEDPPMALSPEDIQAIVPALISALKDAGLLAGPAATADDDAAPERMEAGTSDMPPPAMDKEKEMMGEGCDDDKDKMMDKEKERMGRDQAAITLARYGREREADKKELERLGKQVAGLERDKRLARYERDLIQLEAEGFEFVRSEELADVADLDQAGFDKHVARIKSRYSRSAVGAPAVDVADVNPNAPAKAGADALTAEDTPKVARYMKDRGVDASDMAAYRKALEEYKAARKAG